jgi:ABC-type Na+ efflux pump permease subunit
MLSAMERKSVDMNNSSFKGNLVQGNVDGNVEYKPVSESKSMSETYSNSGNVGAMGHKARADNTIFVQQSEQKQNLAASAKEIQQLLKQLEVTNPTATDTEKIAHVNDETTPSFKRRAVGALQAGGEAAIEEFLDNPYVNVGKAIVKGWIKPE